MINQLAQYFVSLGAVVDRASFTRASAAVDELGQGITGFVQGAAAALTTGAFAAAVQALANRFDELSDVASRMSGVTVEELDKIGYAASLAGTDADTAVRSLESLSNVIGQAANGVGRGAQAFQTFGLSARDAQGNVKTVSDVIDDLRGKLEGLDTAQQTAMLERLGLDRSMLEFLTSDTSEFIAEYEKRTQSFKLSTEEIARLQEQNLIAPDFEADTYAEQMAELGGAFNDGIGRMTRAFQDAFGAIVVRLLPPLATAFNNFANLITENADRIAVFATGLANIFGQVVDSIAFVVTNLVDFGLALGPIPVAIGAIVTAMKAFNFVLALSPIGKIVGLIAALSTAVGYLYDDFKVWQQGGKALFDWTPFVDAIETVKAAFTQLVSALRDSGFFEYLAEAAGGAFKVFTNAVALIGNALGLLVGLVTGDTDMMAEAWEGFKTRLAGIFDGLGDVINGGLQALAVAASNVTSMLMQGLANAKSIIGAWLTENVIEPVSSGLSALFDYVAALPGRILDAVTGFAGSVLSSIADGISSAYNAVAGFFAGIAESIVNALDSAADAVIGWARSFVGSIKGAFSAAVDYAKGLASSALSSISGTLGSVWQAVKGFASDIAAAATGALSSIASALAGWAGSIAEAVSSAFAAAVDYVTALPGRIADAFMSLVSDLGALLSEVPGIITGAFDDALNRVAQIFDDVVSTVRGFFGNLADMALGFGQLIVDNLLGGLLNIGQKMGNAVSSVWGSVKSLFGFGEDENPAPETLQAPKTTQRAEPNTYAFDANAPTSPVSPLQLNSTVPPLAAMPPAQYSTVNNANSSVTNNDNRANTINQTFNVNSRAEAESISTATMRRYYGTAF